MKTISEDKIATIVEEYINSAALEGKVDVREFSEKMFAKVEVDPYAALTGFGRILEFSVFEIIKGKWEESQGLEKGNKKRNQTELEKKPGLGTSIGFLERSENNVNEKVIIHLNSLNDWRNFYTHQRSFNELDDKDLNTAQQCALSLLHYLVWKYECWANSRLADTPRSLKDHRLIFPWQLQQALASGQALARRTIERDVVDEQQADAMAVASIRSQIHAVSEVVAHEAAERARAAAAIYPHSALTLLVPLICDLRWKRGYLSALKRILRVPETRRRLGSLTCEEPPTPCPVSNGILSALQDGSDSVVVCLDKYPALRLIELSPADRESIIQSVNNYGRLGMPRMSGLSLRERIEDIEIRNHPNEQDETALNLFRNREVLVSLIARFGIPGAEWLLPTREAIPRMGIKLVDDLLTFPDSADTEQLAPVDEREIPDVVEEIFQATGAIRVQTFAGGQQSKQLQQLLGSDLLRKLFGDLVDKDPQEVTRFLESLLTGEQESAQQ